MPPYSPEYMRKRGIKQYRRAPVRRKPSVKKVVDQAIMRMAEKKKIATTWTSDTVDTSGQVDGLSNTAQGDNINERAGLKTYSLSVQHRFKLTSPTGTGTNVVRMIWFVDAQQEVATVPTPATVLQSVTPYAPLSDATPGRWIVLKDMLINLDQANYRQKTFQVYLRVPKKYADVQYATTTAVSTTKNGVYVLSISDAPTGLTMTGEQRYSFLDM